MVKKIQFNFMNTRAKHFFIFFLISLTVTIFLFVRGFFASQRMFLGGLGYALEAYFTTLLTLTFLGLAIANFFMHRQNAEHSVRDVSAWAGIIGLLLFGIGWLPLRWYVTSGVGVSSTFLFLGLLLMAISVFEIIKKQIKKS